MELHCNALETLYQEPQKLSLSLYTYISSPSMFYWLSKYSVSVGDEWGDFNQVEIRVNIAASRLLCRLER